MKLMFFQATEMEKDKIVPGAVTQETTFEEVRSARPLTPQFPTLFEQETEILVLVVALVFTIKTCRFLLYTL